MDVLGVVKYYGYRYFHPELGRWISRDPIGEQGGINLYNFAENNAISQSDELGLRKFEPCPESQIDNRPLSSTNYQSLSTAGPLVISGSLLTMGPAIAGLGTGLFGGGGGGITIVGGVIIGGAALAALGIALYNSLTYREWVDVIHKIEQGVRRNSRKLDECKTYLAFCVASKSAGGLNRDGNPSPECANCYARCRIEGHWPDDEWCRFEYKGPL